MYEDNNYDVFIVNRLLFWGICWSDSTLNKPSFIIIGAYRSGTTSLYNYICQHPLVKKAKVKEVNYLNKYWQRGKKWYYSQFPDDCVTGEASPSYMPFNDAVYRMLVDIPDVKVIAILRNPADRLLSHCNKFNVGISESLKYGHYAKQLKPYFDLFNVLVIQSENYFSNEWNTLQRVYDFIGLPQAGIEIRPQAQTNYKDSKHYRWLTDYYKMFNDDLWELLGERWNW